MRVRVEESKESKEKRRSHTLGYHYNCFRGKHFVSTPVIVLFSSKLTEYIKELTKKHPNTSLHHFLGPFCSQRAPKWCQSHQNSAQGGPRTAKVTPKGSKGYPTGSKGYPKGSNRHPKGTQRVPKGPNRHPPVTKMLPKRAQEGTQAILRVTLSYRSRGSSMF